MQGRADVLAPGGGSRQNAGSRPGHCEVLACGGNLAAPIVDRQVDSVHAFGGIHMAHAVSGHGRLVPELPGIVVRAPSSGDRSKEVNRLTHKRSRWYGEPGGEESNHLDMDRRMVDARPRGPG